MKSPRQLADQLASQWQRSDWRESHLLPGNGAWPLKLNVGAPTTQHFLDAGTAVYEHLQAWKAVAEHGPGTVAWAPRRYRGGAAPVEVPLQWLLARPSDAIAAISRLAGREHAGIAADYENLGTVLGQVDARFHRLLLRRLGLWRHLPTEQAITACRVAMQLAPGCAEGKPLRALAVAGNDSKFFERHAALMKALLDVRFDGEANRQGLTHFLDASPEGEHWLLVAPLAEGLLPFRRQRVPTSELLTTDPLGTDPNHATQTTQSARRIVLVENERSLHQLQQPLPNTIAILGSGLDLSWLAAPWLQTCAVAYWGDLDTWGLAMLASARRQLAQLTPLLMDRATFDAHAQWAVREPVACDEPALKGLTPAEAALAQHLRGLAWGRLEQEFLPAPVVGEAMRAWLAAVEAGG